MRDSGGIVPVIVNSYYVVVIAKTLRRDSMLLITLFLNVLDIETKETDLETWQGNSFKFCNSQKDFITFFFIFLQKCVPVLEGLNSFEWERQNHCVYSYAVGSVCNTLCPVLSILYLSVLSTLSYPLCRINSILLTFFVRTFRIPTIHNWHFLTLWGQPKPKTKIHMLKGVGMTFKMTASYSLTARSSSSLTRWGQINIRIDAFEIMAKNSTWKHLPSCS